jgi:pimeloyl-ACP methyl ester carboxylesterase
MSRFLAAWLLLLTEVGLADDRAPGTAPQDVVFTADIDGSEQRYVQVLPPSFDTEKPVDVLIALHGHGSDRWQFIRQERDECRAVRDLARERGLLLVSPDYRAKTSWMGPQAEADLVQIIQRLKQQFRVRLVIVCGASMGGASCLTFTALHPELVDGVASMNGTANHVEYENFQAAIRESFGGTKAEVPGEYRKRSAELWPERFTMPSSFAVGGQDKSVPPGSVLRLAKRLKADGRQTLLIHREQGGHSTSYADACEILKFVLDEAVRAERRGPSGF